MAEPAGSTTSAPHAASASDALSESARASLFLQSCITADSALYDKAMAQLQATKNLAEAQLKVNDKPGDAAHGFAAANLDARVVLGDALMMGAVLRVLRGARLKGVLQLRKAWKVYEGAQDKFKGAAPDSLPSELSHSLKFGVGLFYFIMSIIPSKFLRLAQLAGFRADRAEGLRLLRDVAGKSEIRGPMAMAVLLFNDLIVPRGLADVSQYVREADAVVRQALARYPRGTVWQVMASHCARKQLDLAGGLEHSRLALESARAIGREPYMLAYEHGARSVLCHHDCCQRQAHHKHSSHRTPNSGN
eukprot:m51a1_g6284 hypothetical protein (305) ;mRNA; r:235034-240904